MEVGVFEGRNRFSELVEAAERGETTVVLKRGKPVAKLIPIRSTEDRAAKREQALAKAKAFGADVTQRLGRRLSHDEVMEGKDEGRR